MAGSPPECGPRPGSRRFSSFPHPCLSRSPKVVLTPVSRAVSASDFHDHLLKPARHTAIVRLAGCLLKWTPLSRQSAKSRAAEPSVGRYPPQALAWPEYTAREIYSQLINVSDRTIAADCTQLS